METILIMVLAVFGFLAAFGAGMAFIIWIVNKANW